MREAVLALSAQRQPDLAVVHVPGKDEIECAGGKEVEDVREVAEQDAEVGAFVDEAPRLRAPLPVRARIDADDLEALAARLERRALVHQQMRRRKLGKPGRS